MNQNNMNQNNMNQNIFIYYHYGFKKANMMIRNCVFSWQYYNPNWSVILLDKNSIKDYINIEEHIPNYNNINMDYYMYPNIIKILLLNKYGGVWVDPIVFCNENLDKWLWKSINNQSFWCYQRDEYDKITMMSQWFIYSEKNSYISTKMSEKVIDYWKDIKIIEKYDFIWFQRIFFDLYHNDMIFKNNFDNINKLTSYTSDFIELKGINNLVTDNVIKHVDNKYAMMYKFNYPKNNIIETKKTIVNKKFISNIDYLYQTINLFDYANPLKYNAYPELYEYCMEISENNNIKNILSIGCSKYEVITLKELYFENQSIDGYDIDKSIVEYNNKRNVYKNVHYYNNIFSIPNEKYDMIFCLSPTFKNINNFEVILQYIDSKLCDNGFLILNEETYLLVNTSLQSDYIIHNHTNVNKPFQIYQKK